MTQQTILVVDDEPKIRTLLRNVMEIEGYLVLEAENSAEVMRQIETSPINLITLDIHLGAENGLELARKIRTKSAVPIIMVTGNDDVIDRVVGLEIGADDYITKPFHVREVIARIRSVLRRSEAAPNIPGGGGSDIVTEKSQTQNLQFFFDGMTASPDTFELFDRDGNDCGLTSGDFKLLTIFLKRPKRILSRDQLMDLTGGIEWSPLDRTIDNQIARLRKKIERDPSDPTLIKTVRGIGYTFACEVQTVQPSDSPTKSA